MKSYSPLIKFLSTMKVPYGIFGLLIIALLFGIIGIYVRWLKWMSVMIMPLCMLGATLGLLVLFLKMSASMFWWCESENYGFWGSFFRAFPFFFFVLVQIMDFFILKELMVKRSGSWLSKALFWIIAVVYFLGFLVSIYGFITLMFRFLWQVILSLCACIGLSMFSGNIASRPASSGAPRMYEGANGQKFQNSHDAWSHRQQQNNININNKNRGWL